MRWTGLVCIPRIAHNLTVHFNSWRAYAWALAKARTRTRSRWRGSSIGMGLQFAGVVSDPSENRRRVVAGLQERRVAPRHCGEERRLRSRSSSAWRMSWALMAAPCMGQARLRLFSSLGVTLWVLSLHQKVSRARRSEGSGDRQACPLLEP